LTADPGAQSRRQGQHFSAPRNHRATWAKGFLRVLGGRSSVNRPIISKHPALGFK
jgi:hypothetical protein